jgi:hypothetical protein
MIGVKVDTKGEELFRRPLRGSRASVTASPLVLAVA